MKTVKDYSDNILIDVYLNSKSLRETLRKLNINESGVQIKNLKHVLDNNNIVVKNKYKLDGLIDDIKTHIKDSLSYNDLARKSGYINNDRKYLSSAQLDRLKRFLKKNDIDDSHLLGYINKNGNKSYTDDEIFIEESSISHTSLKKRYLKKRNDDGISLRCDNNCGIIDTWNGEYIALQLDHVNGKRNDNRFNNLRLLCPNCHSQTETYGGKVK